MRAVSTRARISSVQWKIIGVVLMTVVGVGIVLTTTGMRANTDALEAGAIAEVEALATRESNILAAPMSLPATDVDVLQGMPPIQGMFRSEANGGVDPNDGSLTSQWRSRLATIFGVFGGSRPNYTSITLVLADGTEAVSVVRGSDGELRRVDEDALRDRGDDQFFQQALGWEEAGPWVSDVETMAVTPTLVVGLPIENVETGTVGAALLIESRLDDVFAGFQARGTDEFQQILIDDKGRYLSHPLPEKIGANAEVEYGETTPLIIADTGGAHIADGHVVAHEPVFLSSVDGGRYWSIVRQTPTELALAATQDFRDRSILLAIVTLLVAAVVGALFARRWIAGPLKRTVAGLRRVSEGDLTVDFPARSHDEVGQMAGALRLALDSIGGTLAEVGRSGGEVGESAQRLAALSDEMASAATETADEVAEVATSAEQIAVSADSVTASMSQMMGSIEEISRSTVEATGITSQTVDVAARVSEQMVKLDESAVDIGNVVEVITTIAEQTNLLALNASIEAARVGEAGKGFAVVANEVKALAQQTAEATDEIHGKIDAIQVDARSAVDSITEVKDLVERVNDASTTIAGAVEEQSVTTGEVSRSIQAVSEGTQSISDRIAVVAATAAITQNGAATSQSEAADLTTLAASLNELLAHFIVDADSDAGPGALERAAASAPAPARRRPALSLSS